MTSLIEHIHTAAAAAVRAVQGDLITLHNKDGSTTTSVADALIGEEQGGGDNLGDGPPEWSLVVLIPATSATAARDSLWVTARGRQWELIGVGDAYAGQVQLTLRRHEQGHTNLFDLDEDQAQWAS